GPSIRAQESPEQIKHVARRIISNTTPIHLGESNSRVSPQMEQQVRRIADSLWAAYPSAAPVDHTPSGSDTLARPGILSKMKKNILVGGGLILALIAIQVAFRKFDEKKNGPRNKNITNIYGLRKNTPCLVSVLLPTQAEAERLAHQFISQHLIARADILPQQDVTRLTHPQGVLMIAQTVNGRRKGLVKMLIESDYSPIALTILRGQKEHLQWIVNTADGRG
ncbi:MAG: hypothetical protein O3B73_03055, partial [bacterium]|nr:hypothetical protein [bacterium]